MTLFTAALGGLDRVAGAFGVLDRPIKAGALIRIARRQTGLTDFGDIPFTTPLHRLLQACVTESSLSIVGWSATKWDMVRFLSNLLWIQQARRQDPGIDAERIANPIFITGLPRSGTTFLHRLMLLDGMNRAPAVWETIYPSAAAGSVRRRISRVAGQLRMFERLAPSFRSLHPLEATSPQECSEITAHVFRSLRFDTNYLIPSYRAWMSDNPAENVLAYRFHRRFLQFLQHQDGSPPRWVLKCPEHLFALEALRTVYPDARMVFVHRDPVKVLLSQAELTEVLRRPFTRTLDALGLGVDESTRWLDGARRMMAVGDDAGLAEPVCHVHYLDLISDPVSTVAGVYRHFGMTLPAAAEAAIVATVAAKPNGGYGKHDYRFEEHGLVEAEEREKFRPYMVRFGVAAETVQRQGPRGPGGDAAALPERAGRIGQVG